MADPTQLAVPAASALVQYGALGIFCVILVIATGWLVYTAFAKAAQNEADCKARDIMRQAEIAALRAEMSLDRERLHRSITDLADIARAVGRAAVDKQADTDRILFRK